ncbi:MAG: hypothetical protein K9L17_02525 [Clostridiales bacterium]|nr:hypothetical protein [Clostridiales bacterium]MCF8021554.1 hypothetical protein [Clostridiales bacterium]
MSSRMEEIFSKILEQKKSCDLDSDSFLALLSLINLMGLIESIDDNYKTESKSSKNKYTSREGVPLPMAMFGKYPPKESE